MVEIKKELDDDIVVIGLENKDFYVEVTNFGCTLLKAVVKDKEGNPCDCVLGFPEVSDYQKRDGTYLGALVGRVCNRIEKGTFTLNGKTYNVPINNGPSFFRYSNCPPIFLWASSVTYTNRNISAAASNQMPVFA